MARDFSRTPTAGKLNVHYSSATSSTNRFGTSRSHGRSDLITRNKVLGFRRPTPYHAHRCSMTTSGDFFYRTNQYNGYSGTAMPPDGDYSGVYAGATGLYPEIRPAYSQSQINNTINGAIGKLQDDDLNIGQTLGELPDTVRFLADSVLSVLRCYQWVLKGKYGKAYEALFDATPEERLETIRDLRLERLNQLKLEPAKHWLALQLGWKPLLGDIYGAMNALQRDWSTNAPLASAVKNNKYKNSWLLPSGGPYYLKSNGSGTTEIKCKFYYGVRNETLRLMSSVNLINPYSVAWDLVPLSFVVDWFIPIGDFIGSLTAFQGLEYKGGYYTIVNKVNCETEYRHSFFTKIDGTYPSYTLDNFFFQRVELPLPPAGRFAFIRNRTINKGAPLSRALTALSLLQEMRSK